MDNEEYAKKIAHKFINNFPINKIRALLRGRVDLKLKFKQALKQELNLIEDYPAIKLIFLKEIYDYFYEAATLHSKSCTDRVNCPIHETYHFIKLRIQSETAMLNSKVLLNPEINISVITKATLVLKPYSEVLELYERAMLKLNEGQQERNVLDDLRLAIELLLRGVLHNSKSLENNVNKDGELFKYLKDKRASPYIRNFMIQLFNIYTHYQNDNVKHGNNIAPHESEFIINLSCSIIIFLASVANENDMPD